MNLQEAYEYYKKSETLDRVNAIEILYPLVRQRVIAAIGAVTHQPPQEDLIVTCTTDVLMAIDSFKGNSKFSTWVEGITRRMCIDELVRDESGRIPHRKPKTEEEPPPTFQQHAFDKELDPPEEVETSINEDLRMSLYDRLETVLDNEEHELIQKRLAGFTSKEIADELGLPEGTVRRKLFEIVSKIRVPQD